VVPDGLETNELIAAASTGLVASLRALERTNNKSVQCLIRLEPDGSDYPIDEFFSRAKKLLNDFTKMVTVFEAKWPTGSYQERCTDQDADDQAATVVKSKP
jgi:hypothetical protein